MKTFSEKTIFFLAITYALITGSCNSFNNDIIPYSPVDFTIDLTDPQFANLSVIGVSDTIDSTTNNWGERSAGYDGNGIIIYSGPDEYSAYDRTCPYDYAVKGISVKIRLELPSVAECPRCSTRYSLSLYGIPVSGIGKYSLKNYYTIFSESRYIRVWNK
jgi:hypothetical protein